PDALPILVRRADQTGGDSFRLYITYVHYARSGGIAYPSRPHRKPGTAVLPVQSPTSSTIDRKTACPHRKNTRAHEWVRQLRRPRAFSRLGQRPPSMPPELGRGKTQTPHAGRRV